MDKMKTALIIVILFINCCFHIQCTNQPPSVFADALTYSEMHAVKDDEIILYKLDHVTLAGIAAHKYYSLLFFDNHMKREDAVEIVGVNAENCKKAEPLLISIEDTCLVKFCKAVDPDKLEIITLHKDYSYNKTYLFEYSNGVWEVSSVEKVW